MKFSGWVELETLNKQGCGLHCWRRTFYGMYAIWHQLLQNRVGAGSNNFKMRNKHLSPDLVHYSSNLTLQSPSQPRLKAIGSSNKLRTYNSTLLGSSQRTIGNYSYEMGQQIGSGYSSKVYKGYSTKDNKEIAVKVIELKKYSEQSLKMLDNQIQILKGLDHPNVIKCYDIYKTGSHCYIITQLCSNGDLLNYLTRRGKLEETVAVQIMKEIIEGVKYLLGKGILHRDLKPANILNNRKCWKIADFGFAIFSQNQIKTKYNVGTPLYMPLEALVKNQYSPLSDIFSIGVIFYELLTGITPWQCKNQKELIKKMNSLPYCLAERFNISPAIRFLLQKLCSIDPSQRLTKSAFLSIDLKGKDFGEEELQLSSKLILERSRSEIGEELVKSHSNINILSSKSILSEKQIDSRAQTRANHILISQLHYCRFIYYLTRNMNFLLLGSKSKSKLTLILYKHLQKLIQLLADNQNNWFKLKNWDGFKESKKYYSTHLTMKEYSARYEKQYLAFLKKAEASIVREVNKEFNDLSTPDPFNTQLLRKIMTSLGPIIRQANHNTTLAVSEESTLLTPQFKANIEGLRSLFKYYKLIQLTLEDFDNFQSFEKKSNIKVQIDYKNSPNSTIDQFAELRQEVKFI